MPTTGIVVEEYWQFRWQPSRYLLLVRGLLPCAGAIAIGLSGLPELSGWSVVSAATLLILAWHAARCHRRQPVGLLAEDGKLTVELLDGRRVSVRAVQVYCLSWLQVLRLRCWRGRSYTLVVAPDSADRGQRHRWRYFLRYELFADGDAGDAGATGSKAETAGFNRVSRASGARDG